MTGRGGREGRCGVQGGSDEWCVETDDAINIGHRMASGDSMFRVVVLVGQECELIAGKTLYAADMTGLWHS